MDSRKRFLYNGILMTAVGISMRTVALFFNAFVTRSIGAEGMGLHTLVSTVYGFAVTFATSGISLTVTRLVASAKGEGNDSEVGKVLSGAVLYAFLFSAAASLVLFFGAGWIANGILSDGRAASALRILAPSLVPLSMISVFSGYFIGIRKVACNAVTQILGQLFKIAVTVWLVLRASPLGVERAAVTLSLGTTLTEIMSFLVIFIEFLFDRRRECRSRGVGIGDVAKVALPLGVSAYIRQALLTVEHVLIPKRLRDFGSSLSDSLSQYGILHGMALPMILYPMVTLSSFSGLLVPEFAERSAKGDKEAMRRLASEAFSLTLIYAILSSVFLFIFSEELGYVIYDSYSAGAYIAVLAPVVPIMYLDHVTDSVLKGVGEQVYSMWVNITDSFLSIFLVWLLIPKMGIMGYAVCIIAMEAYNFILSAKRLSKRIKFKISLKRSMIYPAISALFSGFLLRSLFYAFGSSVTALWLFAKLVFALCAFVAIYKAMLLVDDLIGIKTSKKQTNIYINN